MSAALLAHIILPKQYAWPEQVKELAHASGIRLDWSAHPFALISQGYDASYSLRTEVNRDLKNLRIPPLPETNTLDIAQVRERLALRQNERTALAVRQQEMASVIREAQNVKSGNEKRAAEAEKKLATELADRELVAGVVLSKDQFKALQKMAANGARAAELEQSIADGTATQKHLQRQMDALGLLDGIAQCPTCSQTIAEDVIAALYAPLKKGMDAVLTNLRTAYYERKAIGDYANAQRKMDASNAAEADLKRIDRRIQELEKAVHPGTVLAAVGPLPGPGSLDSEIKELDDRIERGMTALENISRTAALQAEHDAATQRKSILEAQQARLENLVEYFGPKGVKAQLIKESVGAFEEGINAVLLQWGYSCALAIEPYGFEVRSQNSPFAAQLHQLSKSEKYRFSIAFQVALAVVSGFKFIVVDEFDLLDTKGRGVLNKALYTSDLDQVIMLGTEEKTEAPSAPGTAFILLSETNSDGLSTTQVNVLKRTPAMELLAV